MCLCRGCDALCISQSQCAGRNVDVCGLTVTVGCACVQKLKYVAHPRYRTHATSVATRIHLRAQHLRAHTRPMRGRACVRIVAIVAVSGWFVAFLVQVGCLLLGFLCVVCSIQHAFVGWSVVEM